ncbi:hypothetical protein DRQ53_10145 [bacterium]|nr:MAG: hypothetical protein DRQ53_10145 [bacterium]
MRLLLMVAALLAAACVTPQDLRNVADDLDAYQAGSMTRLEVQTSIRATADEIESRPMELPTTPIDLAIYLAMAGATAFGAKTMTNRERDARRKRLGEKTT